MSPHNSTARPRVLTAKVPDTVCLTELGVLKIVGELKSPWVAPQHDLEQAQRMPLKLRRVLASN
ncbi:hypothetical protein P170DRAFT_475049 [Aspergillus steynii IBT 23096]|uniref:Uncharacterized protein n=1 Tax=Aspergillus steynii IBT 23096 TaxID=1392250 RepID=A0A2I2G763_9EURO|nr:uncharacterized protein P170DRAFT_475049 [Aspergillus steynii IBT 23096]PLB48701.1 hypothetical protein P170DRAFT_475049 [Aspergillus steynii IBT 23096]